MKKKIRLGLDRDDICPATGNGHVPDWKSLQVASDGDDTYVDIFCKKCGRSGCLGTAKTLIRGICW